MEFKRVEGENQLIITEKPVSSYFPIRDQRLQGGLDMDISERISLKQVNVTQRLDPILGYYGSLTHKEYFESVQDLNGQQTTRNKLTDTGWYVYHGKIVKYN